MKSVKKGRRGDGEDVQQKSPAASTAEREQVEDVKKRRSHHQRTPSATSETQNGERCTTEKHPTPKSGTLLPSLRPSRSQFLAWTSSLSR